MDEDPQVTVFCTRCVDLDRPLVPSTRRQCRDCHLDVWFSVDTAEGLALRFPDHEPVTICVKCQPAGEVTEVLLLPEQVQALRASGESDSVIAYKLAIADVSGGVVTLEEAEAEILAFPDGLRAKAFPAAIERATMLVWSTPRS